MRWRLALGAEVLRGLDQARTEELLPEAIDRHPCRQWMSRRYQPLRQPEAIARELLRHWRQHRRADGSLHSNPASKRVERLIGLRGLRDNPCLVPVDRTIVLGEGPAGDHRAGHQANLGRIDFEPHPFAGLRQRSHTMTLSR